MERDLWFDREDAEDDDDEEEEDDDEDDEEEDGDVELEEDEDDELDEDELEDEDEEDEDDEEKECSDSSFSCARTFSKVNATVLLFLSFLPFLSPRPSSFFPAFATAAATAASGCVAACIFRVAGLTLGGSVCVDCCRRGGEGTRVCCAAVVRSGFLVVDGLLGAVVALGLVLDCCWACARARCCMSMAAFLVSRTGSTPPRITAAAGLLLTACFCWRRGGGAAIEASELADDALTEEEETKDTTERLSLLSFSSSTTDDVSLSPV